LYYIVDGENRMKTFYEDRIVRNPNICGGAPIIKGTRVRVKVILDNLAEGHSPEEIVESYPTLSIRDVLAVVAFAAASVTDDYFFPVPQAFIA
jgi:uncharacterized protein (DUF433 family)